MYITSGENTRKLPFIVGSGGVDYGSLCVISSDKVVKASGGESADTIVGIALEDGDADDVVQVELAEANIIRAPYTGSSKTALDDDDLGTVFDFDDDVTVDLDDTTGGAALCVGYDNDAGEILFVVPNDFRYL